MSEGRSRVILVESDELEALVERAVRRDESHGGCDLHGRHRPHLVDPGAWPARAVVAAYTDFVSPDFARWADWAANRIPTRVGELRRDYPDATHGRLYELREAVTCAAEFTFDVGGFS